jgi:hypothetical protein
MMSTCEDDDDSEEQAWLGLCDGPIAPKDELKRSTYTWNKIGGSPV